MKKKTNYVQCHLQKGASHHMAWIPEKFAVIGKFVKIKRDEDRWDDGWEVRGNGGGIVKSAEDADSLSQLYKKTRKASDI